MPQYKLYELCIGLYILIVADYVSPDKILSRYEDDYCWLSRVYESLRPSDGSGALVWAELGAKTLELVHRNIDVGEIHDDEEIMTLGGNFDGESKSESQKIEADFTVRINAHRNDSMYQHLGEKVERLKEQLALRQITSTEYLRGMREIMCEAENIDRLRENLAELFRGMNVPPEQIISDIYDSVSPAMTPNWKNTTEGTRNVKAALRTVMWLKYGIKDEEIFGRAYSYIEQCCRKHLH